MAIQNGVTWTRRGTQKYWGQQQKPQQIMETARRAEALAHLAQDNKLLHISWSTVTAYAYSEPSAHTRQLVIAYFSLSGHPLHCAWNILHFSHTTSCSQKSPMIEWQSSSQCMYFEEESDQKWSSSSADALLVYWCNTLMLFSITVLWNVSTAASSGTLLCAGDPFLSTVCNLNTAMSYFPWTDTRETSFSLLS